MDLTWNEFDSVAVYLKNVLEEHPDHKIVGVARGGLTLATKLSYSLDRRLYICEHRRYDGDGSMEWLGPKPVFGSKIVLVDDMYDSGQTLINLNKWLTGQEYRHDLSVVWVVKNQNLIELPFKLVGSKYTISKEWVNYPWEK